MNTFTLQRLTFLAVLPLCTLIAIAGARAAEIPARGSSAVETGATDAAASAASAAPAGEDTHDDADWLDQSDRHARHGRHNHHRHGNDLVNIGHDSNLLHGQTADSVVSIFGSSTSDGEAGDIVSILGDTRVTGPVSDNAVAILGNAYIDSKIDGDVVAVLGNMDLGPHAEIGGDVVAVGGTLQRDPAAIVHGNVQNIFEGNFGSVGWLRAWIHHCFLYGRPLALAPGLGWAWGLALACLALYAGLALLFREGLSRCVQTFETQPGQTVLAALISVLLTPVLIALLCVTVIGIAAVPFVVFTLFCAGLFGKAVMLAWLGRRVMGRPSVGPMSHPVFAVLLGGVLVLALYLVPVLGFLVYKLLGLLGLGAVVYTVILAARAHQAAKESRRGPTPSPNSTSSPTPASSPSPAPSPNSTSSPTPASSPSPAPSPSATSSPSSASSPSSVSSPSPPPGAPPAYRAEPASTPQPAIGADPAPGAAPASGAPHTPPPHEGPAPATGAQQAQASPPITAALPRAGFWIRMGALLIDGLLVGFLMSVLRHGHHLELLALATYGAVMWKMRGSTIGGTVFDLRVVRLDGRELGWETAIVRALGCFLSLAVAGLGFFWIAFDDHKQAWHDKIAGTVVVRVAKGTPLV